MRRGGRSAQGPAHRRAGPQVPGSVTAIGQTPGVTALPERPAALIAPDVMTRAATFPRLRYMGSKYRLVPHLADVFAEVGGETAADPFSGSGVVSYLLKCQGCSVTSSDYLNFPSVIARATTVNSDVILSEEAIETICGPSADDRDFISTTFEGLYFTEQDRRFLDSAWSHIDRLEGAEKDLAISALVLSAARRQPRGVFTFTDANRYVDGRRDLELSLRRHFRERAAEYNAVVFDNGRVSRASQGEVFEIDAGPYDLVYLDPPYAPPSDDNDYIKRYHFLEGLSNYWRGSTIMENTKTKKLAKRFTPFAYKRTIEDALQRTFERFASSGTIVLSYSSNAVPDAARILELLKRVKDDVEVREVDHKYSFGTHGAATRRNVKEYLFIGRSA
ncbi:DNA methyltransferase [Geodermatophilus sp. TF02-6]|nr:DNA methyltransferase [Geodermatophilus sp. TF02-6]